ncbi:MAG: LysR family transcriptional regulator [Actinobacteria bacterium]|jgi:DNA-binding transcriptional LysR family regulator|nr:LysR family transcriptional regulator [Actinomycetota bacterium]
MALGGLDLNLLRTLQALLDTRNVTRAGERLHLSQPATSAALAKLRRHFDDELLVRVGRDMQLTPLAQTLLPLSTEALIHVERTFDVRAEFDAASSDRRFSVRASDYATCMVNEPMRRLLAKEAPGISVDFAPPPRERLVSGITEADLLVAPVGFGMNGPHDVVLRDHFVAVVSRAHVLDPAECDVVKLLAEMPHVVGTFGEGIVTPADRLLEQLDIRRHVAAAVNGFLSLPMLVSGTDLIALVPLRLARRFEALDDIAVLDIPESASTPLVEAIWWDPARTADPALQWLRGAFVRACEPLSRELPDA